MSATFETVVNRLQIEFPNMELPSDSILKNSLKALVNNKKLFYDNKKECFTAACNPIKLGLDDHSLEDLESLSLREHLITGEEAFTRLHGQTTHYGSDDDREESSTSKKSWTEHTDHYYRKRDSLASTGNSSSFTHKTHNTSDNNRQNPSNSSLRRSSSLRLEPNKIKSLDNRQSTFKRSRSFRLSRRKHDMFEPQESSASTSESNSENCNKCKLDSTRSES